MKNKVDLAGALLETWQTNNQVTMFLIENIPEGLWRAHVPGYKQKTICMVAVHLHNVRCSWTTSVARGKLRSTPDRVDRNVATRKQVIAALKKSSRAMTEVLKLCLAGDGLLPVKPAWLNFPNDVTHFTTYMIAHEAHHRGQIIAAARQLGSPFDTTVTGGVWQWSRLSRKSKGRTAK